MTRKLLALTGAVALALAASAGTAGANGAGQGNFMVKEGSTCSIVFVIVAEPHFSSSLNPSDLQRQ